MDANFPFLPPVPEPRVDPLVSPDFIIGGVAKSGSSSLARYLAQHPQVYLSPVKEPDYFRTDDLRFLYRDFERLQPSSTQHIARRTLAYYEALFSAAPAGHIRGEASITYLRGGRDTALRINAALPSVKLIFILRQPADRAYSNYIHQRRVAVETLPFSAALDAEPRRLATPMHGFWGYRTDGFYHDKLRAFYDVFGPDRIKVLLYDDWRAPATLMREVFTFIGVDPSFPINTAQRYNEGTVPLLPSINRRLEPARSTALRRRCPDKVWHFLRASLHRLRRLNLVSAPPLDPRLHRSLTESYRDDILKTQALIGRDLSAWLA